MSDLERIINDAFEERDDINVNTAGDIRNLSLIHILTLPTTGIV